MRAADYLWPAVGLLTGGFVALVLLLFAVPPGLVTYPGLAWNAAGVFEEILLPARHISSISPGLFLWKLRIILVLIWMSWLVVVLAGRGAGNKSITAIAGYGCALVVALALLAPPVLSHDVLAYAAFARMAFAHGLNPYTSGAADLVAAGDPAAEFLVWNLPLPYGPLWTLMAIAIGWLGSPGGLFAEVVAHKLLAGIALVVCAVAVRRMVEQQWPRDARLMFIVVLLCPLFLIEAPASGHNDFLMMAFMLGALVASGSQRWLLAALLCGLAAAIKPVAFGVLPLLLFDLWLRNDGDAWRKAAIAAVLSAVPFILLSLPFGGAFVLVEGSLTKLNAGRGGALAFDIAIAAALIAGAAIVWVGRREPQPTWLLGWVPVAAILILFGTVQRYPWYASWMLLPSLTGLSERHQQLFIVSGVAAVLLSWTYTLTP